MPTKITWTNETWNPVVGCSPVSEGCENCYAAKMARRLALMGNAPHYQGITNKHGYNGKIGIPSNKVLYSPLHWRQPRMIFVCSMGDLFHDKVPNRWIKYIFDIIDLCPQHTFQILTKRPERMLEFFTKYGDPLPNVWLGVSAENQRRLNERLSTLWQTPAYVRFLSLEPLLAPVVIQDACPEWWESSGINWVIVGCESGPGRRPCKIEWIESVVNQCKKEVVHVFVKQLAIGGKVVRDINQFPEHLRIREYPK